MIPLGIASTAAINTSHRSTSPGFASLSRAVEPVRAGLIPPTSPCVHPRTSSRAKASSLLSPWRTGRGNPRAASPPVTKQPTDFPAGSHRPARPTYPEVRGATALDCGELSPTADHLITGTQPTEGDSVHYIRLKLAFIRLYLTQGSDSAPMSARCGVAHAGVRRRPHGACKRFAPPEGLPTTQRHSGPPGALRRSTSSKNPPRTSKDLEGDEVDRGGRRTFQRQRKQCGTGQDKARSARHMASWRGWTTSRKR